MTELISYFSGFVTLLFGLGFYFGLQEFKKLDPRYPGGEERNNILD